MVRSKNISPSWSDVKTALLDFDRAGVCTENLIRVDDVMELPKLAE